MRRRTGRDRLVTGNDAGRTRPLGMSVKRIYHLSGAAAILVITALATTLTINAGDAHAAAAETAPCAPSRVTRTDEALARSLNAQLGRGMPGRVSGYQASCARAIVREVKSRGLDRRAAVIAVTTALVAGDLNNYTRVVDGSGFGLFHQRAADQPGADREVLNPLAAPPTRSWTGCSGSTRTAAGTGRASTG